MSDDPGHRSHWRVGYSGDPLGFVPLEICEYSHRSDDLRHRFRTIYVAELAETSLREPLADFRPKLSTIDRFQREMGAEAARELSAWPITAAWRREHVLAPVLLKLDGPICDLTDIARRQAIEERHSELLLTHEMEHFDLHEITTSRRFITQTIAGDLYDEGVAAVRFPSHLEGYSAGERGRARPVSRGLVHGLAWAPVGLALGARFPAFRNLELPRT